MKKKQTRDIKYKILVPVLTLIVAFALVIFIFLNLVLVYSLHTAVIKDLNYVAKSLEEEYAVSSFNKEQLLNSFTSLTKKYETINDIRLIITDKKNNIIFSNVLIAQDTINFNSTKEIKSYKNNMWSINNGENNHLIKRLSITMNESEKIYISTSTDSIFLILKYINRILYVLLVIALIICIIIVNIISNRISKPIAKLCSYADNIGNGIFIPITLENKNQTLEVLSLSKSMNLMVDKLIAFSSEQKKSIQTYSHELRTPLMSIQGYAEAIKYGVIDDTDSAVDVILEESKRLSNLVDQILTLSKLETLTQELCPDQLSLNEIINDTIILLKGLTMKNNIKLIFDTKFENMLIIIDKELLSRILINLISNCIRYAKTSVWINLYYENQNAVISIEDDGNGLSKEDLENIFKRNYTGKDGIFGLGLSIAKSSIDYIGGEINAENGANGAKFIIKLPI